MRADRRHRSRNKLGRLFDELFRINTGVESRQEMLRLIYKRSYCEQSGRRRSGGLANYARRLQQSSREGIDAIGRQDR